MRRLLLALPVLLPVFAYAEPPLCSGPCLLTGGETGDYYRHFGPPVQRLLKKAWVEVPIAVSPGAPASLAWVMDHPDSYALVQGDVLARALKDPSVAAKVRVLRGTGIGDEAVLAVVTPDLYERSGGSWTVLSRHAARVQLYAPSKASGPGATLMALQSLDPDGIGKGVPVFMRSMDDAISATRSGGALAAAMMVQFANPDNPRFKAIADANLRVMPVISSSMRNLKFPDGGSAYRICEGVQVGVKEPLTTACTPIQLVTGASNDNVDLGTVFAAANDSDFVPQEAGFARFWRTIKSRAANAASSAFDAADRAAKSVSDRL